MAETYKIKKTVPNENWQDWKRELDRNPDENTRAKITFKPFKAKR